MFSMQFTDPPKLGRENGEFPPNRWRAKARAAWRLTRTWLNPELGVAGTPGSLGTFVDFWRTELDPMWSRTTPAARVHAIIEETHDVKTFVLEPNSLWRGHVAGQFLPIDVEILGVLHRRCYSISSAPFAVGGQIAITVKRVPGGLVSTFLHDKLRHGDVIRIGAATGEFLLPTAPPRKLLLLSGGSGATPGMSILRSLCTQNNVKDVVYLHAARTQADRLFAGELQILQEQHKGLQVLWVLEDSMGRLDEAKLRTLVPDLMERHTMMCGPAGMMESLGKIWSTTTTTRLSPRPALLQTERFGLGPTVVDTETVPIRVTLRLAISVKQVEVGGVGSLLEQLESKGVRPANGCRIGICNTCRCRKISGAVEDIRTGEVSTEANEDIRLCISQARTDLELAL